MIGSDVHSGHDPASLTASAESDVAVAEALLALTRANIAVAEFSLGQPSLDEVFFALTGRGAEERKEEISA